MDNQLLYSGIDSIQPLYGTGADMFGRKPMMITALVLFSVGSSICGGAKAIRTLIGGRVIQDLGGSGLGILPGLIVYDLVRLRERHSLIGIA